MTTAEVLAAVQARGLTITVKDGRPVLGGKDAKKYATPALLKVLRWHRDGILKWFGVDPESAPPPPEVKPPEPAPHPPAREDAPAAEAPEPEPVDWDAWERDTLEAGADRAIGWGDGWGVSKSCWYSAEYQAEVCRTLVDLAEAKEAERRRRMGSNGNGELRGCPGPAGPRPPAAA